MPAVLSKFHKNQLVSEILTIVGKYKGRYSVIKKTPKKLLSKEALNMISRFKMHLMMLGLPKDAINLIHAKMIS